METSTPWTTAVLPKDLRTCRSSTEAMRDQPENRASVDRAAGKSWHKGRKVLGRIAVALRFQLGMRSSLRETAAQQQGRFPLPGEGRRVWHTYVPSRCPQKYIKGEKQWLED
jgi:hypothetical protein